MVSILNPELLLGFRLARKVQAIRAKPMVTLLVDRSVATKFLVNTLEAQETVSPDSVFCIGMAGDAWQQSASHLLKKYTVTAIDTDGWMVCEPKAENACLALELTGERIAAAMGSVDPDRQLLYIEGLWGQKVGDHENLQLFEVGDFLLCDRDNPKDRWIVKRRFFLNTYTLLA